MIDELLSQFKNQYSSSETLQLFSGCNGTTQKYLSKKFTEEPIHKVESQIESCKKKRKADKGSAYEFGLKLFTNTKDDLSLLKSLLATSDLKYKAVADQLANEIMQCGIDYFNESQKNNSSENYLESAQKLNKKALSIAVGKLTKDRAKDSLATLEEMKDQEVNRAIQVLQSIKDAYEKNERYFYQMIAKKGISIERLDSSKVRNMIKNSFNWDKITELIEEAIPRKNISKIKNAQNTSKISEYKNLVEFVLDKVGYYQKSKIQYLQYWRWQPSKTTESSSSTKTASPTSKNGIMFLAIVVGVGGIEGAILSIKYYEHGGFRGVFDLTIAGAFGFFLGLLVMGFVTWAIETLLKNPFIILLITITSIIGGIVGWLNNTVIYIAATIAAIIGLVVCFKIFLSCCSRYFNKEL